MDRPSFDSIYMGLARALSMRSTCSRSRVGAVVVSDDNHKVLAIGYNGSYRGGNNGCDTDVPGACGCLHAEDNCLLKMDYGDHSKKRMYVTLSPCTTCAKRIVNAGVDEVVYLEQYRDPRGLDILRTAGVLVRRHEEVTKTDVEKGQAAQEHEELGRDQGHVQVDQDGTR